MTMKNRSDLIGLALPTCAHCHGTALSSEHRTCKCVDREVFRACLERFTAIQDGEEFIAPISLEHAGSGPRGYRIFSRKNEEYCADFVLVAKRTLDALEYDVFRFHMLLGADWKLCCKRLKIDRGTFFHAVYRTEQKLGRVFRTLKPYSLFPLGDYYFGTVRGRKIPASVPDEPAQPEALQPPVMSKAERLAYIRERLAEQPLTA
jgi:hypothetical protein